MVHLEHIFPENMIYLNSQNMDNDNRTIIFLLKSNSIGKIHFKRDFNEDTFLDAYKCYANKNSDIFIINNKNLCTKRLPYGDKNKVSIIFSYDYDLEKYTELNQSSINKLYYFDRENINEWKNNFIFNIYSFKGFALSELFKDGIPSNDNIKNHEIKINFTSDLINMKTNLTYVTNTYYILVNDLYIPDLSEQYYAYGEIHVNNTLNPLGVINVLNICNENKYYLDEEGHFLYSINLSSADYKLENKNSTVFTIQYFLQAAINNNMQDFSYIPIILSDHLGPRNLNKNDFVAFSLNLVKTNITTNSNKINLFDYFSENGYYYGDAYYNEYNSLKYDEKYAYSNPVSKCVYRCKLKKSPLINNQVFYIYPNIQTRTNFSCDKLTYYRIRSDMNYPSTSYIKFDKGKKLKEQDKVVIYPLGYIDYDDIVKLNVYYSGSSYENFIIFDKNSEITNLYTKCTLNDNETSNNFFIGEKLYDDNFVTITLDINELENRFTYNYFEGFYFEYIINTKEQRLFLPFDKSSINNMGYFYSLNDDNFVWNNLNKIIDVFDSNLGLLEEKLKNTYKKIENMISISSILQINLNKQKKVLDTKATVNDYKVWLDKNFQKIAGLYYRTNEFLTDIYTSSSKGLNISINETSNNLTTDLTPKGYAIFYNDEESHLNNLLVLKSHNVAHFIDKESIDKESINYQLVKMMNIEAYNFLDSLASYSSLDEYNKYFARYKDKKFYMDDLRCKLEDYTSNESFMTKLLNAVKSKDTKTKIFDYPDNFM